MVEEDFDLRLAYVGPGYGVASSLGEEAFDYLVRTEGILLDPVYSGKGFSGLIDAAERGEIPKGSRVVFVHTGGLPGVFAYAEDVLKQARSD